ncbi:lysozyme inhibitor LprI family protein [Microbulbifer sp. SSSA002]|uniref:lysozyme inhibitor LprI family protein n=1 Tax=unclassified Microbulbifer TaxID=2619833 RepID=UPI004039EE2B
MKKVMLAFLLVSPSMAFADNCDRPRDDFDGLYCLNKVYQAADAELNETYVKLRGHLNSSQKAKLKKTQVAWIKKRNKSCSRRDADGFFVNLSCTTKTTISRTNTLNDRIRECKATGCQSSKL